MTRAEERPDPDALLRHVQAEHARARRGRLRIFFGFAPGVGKTYRMLQVARAIAETTADDVVVGVVEDHKRRETADLVADLPRIPLRRVEYRGHTILEFDLDAALVRAPKLILVDELAHTNAPGCRHAKRWQDVAELIDAGIDVFTTMNVQHVESLNDVVAQITRVRVRETVPDSVLDDADAIELVDIAPEELLSRLRAGKVYLGDSANRAADHFFQRGNLLALRELALRRTAQLVDDDVRAYREAHGVASTWPAGERVLVCVGPAPSSDRLIRAAARTAAGLRCPWHAVYVDATTGRPFTDDDRVRLNAHLALAESLGATTARLSGASVADTLLHHARRHNVTRLIIGKPTHGPIQDRMRGSLLDAIVRGSGDIDVHVISGDAPDGRPSDRGGGTRPGAPAWQYAAALAMVASALGLSLVIRGTFDLPDLEMLFLLNVMITAGWFGRGPAVLSAALGVAAYDFFFVPPYNTFSVADKRYFLTFAMMFGVGIAMSELASRLRRQEQDAVDREQRTSVLYALTKDLASMDEPTAIAQAAARHARGVFRAQSATVLATKGDAELETIGVAPAGAHLDARDLGVAKWSLEHEARAGLGTDTLPGAGAVCTPLLIGATKLGVLALLPIDRRPLDVEQRTFLDVFARHVATALERARLAASSRHAALRAHTEEMRSSLLSAVSHDLRTPLATITGTASLLRDEPGLADTLRHELLDGIVDEAARLERLVTNLLDITRLESGAVALKLDWVPVEELVGPALARLERRLAGRDVRVRIAADVPLAHVDPVVFEQLLVNLLDNTAKHTPAGTPVELVAWRDGATIVLEVSDRGPGLPAAGALRLFEKFQRGLGATPDGAGLGLAICRGIAAVHRGTIEAEDRDGGGATFRVRLPADTPPLPTTEDAS